MIQLFNKYKRSYKVQEKQSSKFPNNTSIKRGVAVTPLSLASIIREVRMKTNFSVNNKLVITAIGIVVVALGVGIYFGLRTYLADYAIKNIAKEYVTNFNPGKTPQQFTATLQSLGTKTFLARETTPETLQYKAMQGNETSTIKCVYLIDRRPTALEAVVYYTLKDKRVAYSNLMQANIVMFKEPDGWKIDYTTLAARLGTTLPQSDAAEQAAQSARFIVFQNLVKAWTLTRDSGDLRAFVSYFSSKAPVVSYKKTFMNEQSQIKKNKLAFNVVTTAVEPLSSTNLYADLLVINELTVNGKASREVLRLEMIYEKGSWKIDRIYKGGR